MNRKASTPLSHAVYWEKPTGFSGGRDLVRCGAELAEFSERFYRGIFLGMTGFVGLAALIALVLLPLRASSNGPPVSGVILGSVIVVATPLAVSRTERLYRALRRRLAVEIGVVLYAAALVAAVFPLRSQLWWPSCTLLMLVAVVAPIRRVLVYCVTVLAINLLAHVLSGDIAHTPAVSIIGLWIGYIFWSVTVAAVTDQLAAHLMQLESRDVPRQTNARPVVSWSTDRPTRVGGGRSDDTTSPADGEAGPQARPTEPLSEGTAAIADDAHDERTTLAPAVGPAGRGLLQRLTARQLQVLALLADGLRYRDVAACLSISDGQVQRHVARAVDRLGVSNATELVAVAIREGLVPPATARPPAG
jgi:DNA-binding CsgD family transcriptional regulator